MPVKRGRFKWWIRSIFATHDEEILCSEYVELLPRFVDLKLAGEDAEAALPQVRHHLKQCPECVEVYRVLLKAASLEEDPR